jgi:hypothetical protein
MHPFAIRLAGMLGAALLAGLAIMMAFAPFSVDVRARGDPIWLIPLKLGIVLIPACAVLIVLTRVMKRRLKKGATEIQITAAALALIALLLGSWVLSMRFALGT